MTKILGISGKKQSGKDTAANYILGSVMRKLNLIREFKITPQGKLYVWWDNGTEDTVDYDSNTRFISDLKDKLNPHIKLYSFADCLKKEICIKMLGLTWEQCYGTDEQKNSLTELKWEDMPGVSTLIKPDGFYNIQQWGYLSADEDEDNPIPMKSYFHGLEKILIFHNPGQMTAREVLQFVGTEIMRKMYGNAHVNATMNQIEQDAPEYAIIRDTRFVNEVEGVSAYGITCRLLRDVNKGKDQHESETALDNYPLDNYDLVIDNTDMTIQEQNAKVYEFLKTQGWEI